MPNVPFQKRPHDVFVSYSHEDADAVKHLVEWLKDDAGLKVWWDKSRLVPGARLFSALPQGLESARAALFCVSRSWVASSWCEEEAGAALQERHADPRYNVLALRLDDVEMPKVLANAKWVEMQELALDEGAALLKGLVAGPPPWTHTNRDIYLSRSWRGADTDPADRVCQGLLEKAYRLIGDSPDYAAFDEDRRLAGIVRSCGALVAVLPRREDPEHGFTSEYVVREAHLAQELNIPYVLLSDDGVEVPDDLWNSGIGRRVFRAPKPPDDRELGLALDQLEEYYHGPREPAFSFIASSLRTDPHGTEEMRDLIEQVTSMPCLLGQQLQGQHAQREIIDSIRGAQFVLADVTNDHRNSLIEAGIARGAETRLHLMCQMPESGVLSTRFMFRDLEMNWYRNPVQKIGLAHRIARMYRRHVYNLTPSKSG